MPLRRSPRPIPSGPDRSEPRHRRRSFTQGGCGRTVSAGGINQLDIAEQASHGRAGTSGLSGWFHAATRGYAGKDRFVLAGSGEIMYDRIIRGTSHVDADVVP